MQGIPAGPAAVPGTVLAAVLRAVGRAVMGAVMVVLPAALALLLASGSVLAGSAEAPELTDPEGDQEVTRGALVLPPDEDAFADIDILAAWVETDHEGQPVYFVQTQEPPQSGARFALSYRIEQGPTSYWTSTADGSLATLERVVEEDLQDAVVQLGEGFPTTNATGGDLVTIVEVTATRSADGTQQLPTTEDDQQGTDSAGPGTAYTLPRPPVTADVRLSLRDSSVAALPEGAYPADADLDVRIEVENTGTDLDTYTAAPSNGTVRPDPWTLEPGQAALVTWSIPAGTAPGNATLVVQSTLGAQATFTLQRVLPASDAQRETLPANLSPLAPLAAAIGFDTAFGGLGELALLGLLVLVGVLVLYWASDVAPRPAPLPPRDKKGSSGDMLSAATRDLGDAGPAPQQAAGAAGASSRATASSAPRPAAAARPRPDRLDEARRGVDALGARTKRLVVRLEDIRHEPEDPEPGEEVHTTAKVRNGGEDAARLRLVVQVDGQDVKEETIMLGPGQVRPVDLRWVSRGGDDVRMQVYDAS